MIKHACENNMNLFHFGRSSIDSGGEFFKKKWNAQQKQLFWQYQLGKVKYIPQLNVHNPKYTYCNEYLEKTASLSYHRHWPASGQKYSLT